VHGQPVPCEGETSSERAASCADKAFLGPDYTCDELLGKCVATPSSAACQAKRGEIQASIDSAEQLVAGDYACPDSQPEAPCHDDEYTSAFVAEGAAHAVVRACDLVNLADVGRAFGRSLTHEFALEIPNPWVRRYLEDVARAA